MVYGFSANNFRPDAFFKLFFVKFAAAAGKVSV